jgi:hypothetical protein
MFPKSSGLRKQADVKTVERHADFIEFATDHNRDRAELWVERAVGVVDAVRYILSPRMRLEVAKLDLTSTLFQLSAVDDSLPHNAPFSWYVDRENPEDALVMCRVKEMPGYQDNPTMSVTFGSDVEHPTFSLNGEVREVSDRDLTSIIRNMNEFALGELAARTASSTDSST